METIQAVLTAHPFFADFPPHHVELVAGCARNVHFDTGRFIFHEGEDAHRFYVIREGKIGLHIASERRGPLTLLTLGPGEIVGWSWMFPPYRWKFSAKALEPTRAFAIDGMCLRGKAENDHDLAYELLKRFARVSGSRLETMRLQLVSAYKDELAHVGGASRS